MKFIIYTLMLFAVSCSAKAVKEKDNYLGLLKSFEQLQPLTGKRIYFGHKSVGQNILNGMRIIEQDGMNLPFIITGLTKQNPDKGLIESMVGENRKPELKLKEFETIIDKNFSGALDCAFIKFCFADVRAETDVESLFNLYSSTVNKIKSEYPGLKLFHFTVPLVERKINFKDRIKLLLCKKINPVHGNIKRTEYNGMLVKKYGDDVFDIARIESGDGKGNRNYYLKSGKKYYSLSTKYSLDGGHLNYEGSKLVAQKLLLFLAERLN